MYIRLLRRSRILQRPYRAKRFPQTASGAALFSTLKAAEPSTTFVSFPSTINPRQNLRMSIDRLITVLHQAQPVSPSAEPSDSVSSQPKNAPKRKRQSKESEALQDTASRMDIPDLDPILSRFVNTSPTSEVVEYVIKLNLSVAASSALLVRLFREGKLAFAMAFAARLAEDKNRADVVWACGALISALIDTGRLTEAHNLLSNIPLPRNNSSTDASSNSLRSRVSKLMLKFLEKRKVQQAWELFQLSQQHQLSVFSSALNMLGSSLLQLKRTSDAYTIFSSLASSNIVPAAKFSIDLARSLRTAGRFFEADEVTKTLERNGISASGSDSDVPPSDPELAKIVALASSGEYRAASNSLMQLEKMREVPLNASILRPMISAAANAGDLPFVKSMIKKLESRGISPDKAIKGMEMKAMFKSGDARGAFKYLERMRASDSEHDWPSKITYSVAISCLVDLGLPTDIVQEWMEEDGFLDENDTISMGLSIKQLVATGDVAQAEEILQRLFTMGTRVTEHAYMSLLKHFMVTKSYDDAKRIIEMIEAHKVDLSVTGHSLLMHNWAKMGNREAVLNNYAHFLNLFKTSGVTPSLDTIRNVMKSLHHIRALEELCDLWMSLQADARILPQCELYSSMTELMAASMDKKAAGEIVLQAITQAESGKLKLNRYFCSKAVVRVIDTQLGSTLLSVKKNKPRTESLWNAIQKDPKMMKLYDSLHPNSQVWLCFDESEYGEILSTREVAAFAKWFRQAYQARCEPLTSTIVDKLRTAQAAT
eukprot:TRINITY_DN288_c1_g5_i1.p1 TRINITY_DN288_c1_g5~~TRINITY_DN288_c1_g5_i1.p1  ORF type:complete len:769 (-),score=120.00 TRINITY_DN288_c1_g5_i1:156-2462(-)